MTVATPEPMGSELVLSERQTRFTEPQRVALSHMGVGNAPDEDVDVFFHVCQRTKLDPFARQIYMIGRKERVQRPDGEWVDGTKYTIQAGIDGYRTIARRVATATGDELSYGDMLWCGRDGVWHDVWLGEPQELYAAKATVLRNGKPWTHVALWREYVQTKRNGEPNSMWANKGANQLAKCAEAGALRKAFPQDYAGVYVDAELEHLASEAASATVVPGSVAPARDWWAEAEAATDVGVLGGLWREAHRHGALDDRLKDHMQALKAKLLQASEPAPEVHEAEVVDEQTGEVLDAEQAPLVKSATAKAIVRELARCGVAPESADAYLSVLGVPRDRIADLSQVEAEELLTACRSLDRDKLAALMADAAGGES